MILDLHQLQELIYHYKYFVIFPLAVIEGPIITVISGFLAAGGYVNFFLAYGLIVIADLVGDTILYVIGRYVKKASIVRFGKYLGLTEIKLAGMETYFAQNSYKTFTFGKIAHGAGSLVLLGAGMIKIPYGKFMAQNVLPTIVKSAILILVGYYFGTALAKINKYLDVGALIVGALLIALYIVYVKFSKKKI